MSPLFRVSPALGAGTTCRVPSAPPEDLRVEIEDHGLVVLVHLQVVARGLRLRASGTAATLEASASRAPRCVISYVSDACPRAVPACRIGLLWPVPACAPSGIIAFTSAGRPCLSGLHVADDLVRRRRVRDVLHHEDEALGAGRRRSPVRSLGTCRHLLLPASGLKQSRVGVLVAGSKSTVNHHLAARGGRFPALPSSCRRLRSHQPEPPVLPPEPPSQLPPEPPVRTAGATAPPVEPPLPPVGPPLPPLRRSTGCGRTAGRAASGSRASRGAAATTGAAARAALATRPGGSAGAVVVIGAFGRAGEAEDTEAQCQGHGERTFRGLHSNPPVVSEG